MSRDQIEDLLHRYSRGETTTRENELVERWLEENRNSESGWSKLDKASKDQWLSGVFEDIQRSIHQGDATVVPLHQKKNLFKWQNIAAVAAITLLFSTLFIAWPILKEDFAVSELTSVTTPNNEKKLIVLSDNSRVWANAGTTIKYSKEFDDEKREVWLTGEAYFDIHHDTRHPFIIYTGKLVTTVLGTAFNIKEDKKQHTIAVTVTRGKVSVANSNRILGILSPNQQITFNTDKNKGIQQTVDARQIIAWKQNDLHFEDVSFAAAAKQLEQYFGVNISFANEKLKTCRFTGTSIKGENIEKILKVICEFNNAIYKMDANGDIIIYGEGCE
jgi:transmembrane sensor